MVASTDAQRYGAIEREKEADMSRASWSKQVNKLYIQALMGFSFPSGSFSEITSNTAEVRQKAQEECQ